MKNLISLVFCILLGASLLTGCSGHDESYAKKSYASQDTQISEVCIDVRDRQVEVTLSADEQIHIDYYENSKEYYDISVSEDNVLTVTAVNDKEWTDFIGGKAPEDVRVLSVQVPDTLLHTLSISTTNEDISIEPLTLTGSAVLSANGGNISFEGLDVGNEITADVKNGNVSGTISGSYDEYAISCTIKKGESNLPPNKEGGSKKLLVTANNGDVMIEIMK